MATVRREDTYTVWFHKKQEAEASWSNNLLEVSTGHPGDILYQLNHFGLPSALGRPRCDLCVFRSHIVPMWEDPNQARGGRWIVELNRDEIDVAWYRTIMEWFRAGSDEWLSVTGVYLMVRPKSKIALWFADSMNSGEIVRIRNHWGNVIGHDKIKNAICDTYANA